MPKWSHIDTTGLDEHFDCADLIEQDLSRDEIAKWMMNRKKDGPPPLSVKPVDTPPKATKKPKPKPAPKSIPVDDNSNVAALKKPDLMEEYGFPPEFSEDALAERFTERTKDNLVYCGAWKKWLEWGDGRWTDDSSFVAIDHARKMCREVNQEVQGRPDLGRQRDAISNKICTHNSYSNIEKIAKSDRRHHVNPADFDADPWLLNTPDGIVDLKTGDMRPARRKDLVRKQTAVGPGGDCPTWKNFLKVATRGDEELQGYLQRIAGYCLTGSIAEHAFFFLYGGGGNGKGTYKDILDWMLQDYARAANIDTFTEQRFNKHSSDVAFFQGARLVTATETPEGSRWAEAKIKAMTGGDPITANHMHQNPFTFYPLFKLVFTGNHKPQLKTVDAAIKRRLYLIPFEHTVSEEEKDLYLGEKLKQEGGGILNWMIEGCLDWQQGMLRPPARVRAHTAEYLATEDRIGRFLEEFVTISPPDRVKSALLYLKYKNWAEVNNEYAMSKRRFMEALRKKGYQSEKRAGEQVIMGMGLSDSFAS